MNAAVIIRMVGVLAMVAIAAFMGADGIDHWWLLPGAVLYALGEIHCARMLDGEFERRNRIRLSNNETLTANLNHMLDRVTALEAGAEEAKKAVQHIKELQHGVDCGELVHMVVDMKQLVGGVNCATLREHVAKTQLRVDAVEDAVSMERFQSILVRLYGRNLVETFTGHPEKPVEPIMVNEALRMLLHHLGLTIQRTAAETKLVPVSKPGKKVRRG